MSTAAVIYFSSSASAAGLVAGLPAAARAIREVALAGLGECWLEIDSGGPLTLSVQQEIARMAGEMRVHRLDRWPLSGPAATGHAPKEMARKEMTMSGSAMNWQTDTAPWPDNERMLMITGGALVEAAAIRAALAAGESLNPGLRFGDAGDLARNLPLLGVGDGFAARYAVAGRAIIRATAKSTDGLVSRSLNRPISQSISSVLMNFPGIRPIHATIGTAVLAVLMFAVLVMFGSPAGLVAGAILFQAASVFDGVDGEIARATYRTTDRGAMIDSLIDAATNLSFVAGIVINLAQRGRWGPAMFGIAGLAMLALGLTILGTRARRNGGPITFDGLKGRFRDSGSGWGKWAVWLTMRDFLALAAVVLVVAGLTEQAIMAFSVIMAGWLAVVLTTHMRQSARHAEQDA